MSRWYLDAEEGRERCRAMNDPAYWIDDIPEPPEDDYAAIEICDECGAELPIDEHAADCPNATEGDE